MIHLRGETEELLIILPTAATSSELASLWHGHHRDVGGDGGGDGDGGDDGGDGDDGGGDGDKKNYSEDYKVGYGELTRSWLVTVL